MPENQPVSRRELFEALFGKVREAAGSVTSGDTHGISETAATIARTPMTRRDFGKITGGTALATQLPPGMAEPILKAAASAATEIHPVFGLVARLATDLPNFRVEGFDRIVRPLGSKLKTPEEIGAQITRYRDFNWVISALSDIICRDPEGTAQIDKAIAAAAPFPGTDLRVHLLEMMSPKAMPSNLPRVFDYNTSRYRIALTALEADPNDPFALFDLRIKHMFMLWPETMNIEQARSLQLYSMFSIFSKQTPFTHHAIQGETLFDISGFAPHDQAYTKKFFTDLKEVFREAYPDAAIDIDGKTIRCKNMPDSVNNAISQTLKNRAERGDGYLAQTHSRRADNFYGADYHRESWAKWEKERSTSAVIQK